MWLSVVSLARPDVRRVCHGRLMSCADWGSLTGVARLTDDGDGDDDGGPLVGCGEVGYDGHLYVVL